MACCKTSQEILNLLLSSIRIYEDIEHFLKVGENVFLSLREFNTNINGLYEFRCFVKGNNLKGITQYNHPWVVEELLDQSFVQEIKFKIIDYFNENLKEKLNLYENYVFDVAFIEDKSVILIEINPVETSGKGLFSGEEGFSKEDVDIRVRDKIEIPYDDHWNTYLQYLMKDYCDAEPYYNFLTQNIKK